MLICAYGHFHDWKIRLELSVQFSRSVVSDSLQPHEPQHTRPPSLPPSPGSHSNPCPLSWCCHPTISSSVVPFSSCPQSFPASGSFRIRWPKYWSFNFSISPSNEHPGLISFRMDWLHLLAVQDSSRVFSNTIVQSIHSSMLNILYNPTHIHT